MKFFTKIAALALLTLAAACSSVPEGELFVDPYENTNRTMHSVNKTLDTAVLRPASQAYGAVTPTLVRHLVGNAFDMLDMPAIFANNVLQGDAVGALSALGRFGVNVLMGAGLLDPATEMGLPKEDTDFGETLATWGAGQGAYLELPLLGPGHARDHLGRIVDGAFNPLTYVSGVPAEATAGLRVGEIIHFRHENAVAVNQALYESEDSYRALRNAYVQMRRRQLDGGVTEESLPDVFDQQ